MDHILEYINVGIKITGMKKVFPFRGIGGSRTMDEKNREDTIELIAARVDQGIKIVDVKDVVTTLKIPENEAREILQDLEEDGYLHLIKN